MGQPGIIVHIICYFRDASNGRWDNDANIWWLMIQNKKTYTRNKNRPLNTQKKTNLFLRE